MLSLLSSENKLPLYLQLVKTLKKQIKENMKENDKIPSEKEICDMYSVSRTTVRLAMAELEKTALYIDYKEKDLLYQI